MKKIIYGISNYKMAREKDYLYIDKTQYIEKLENINEKYLIFLRPRRFGKSLFLSTLHYYYDEKSQDEFDAIFGDTYIGKNPTPLKSSYRILFFEFSGIEVTANDLKVLYKDFTDNIKKGVVGYFKEYNYPNKYVEKIYSLENPKEVVKVFFEIVRDDQIYLLIDEYDQFANAILAHSMQEFLKIVGKGGFVRSYLLIGSTDGVEFVNITGTQKTTNI
jgi:hypothetical protein